MSALGRRGLLAALFTATALFALPAGAQAIPHTYVSGVGDDAYNCTLATPCKTFAGAISRTDEGGIITPVDAGPYGNVTVTKSVTIDGDGRFASIVATNANGIVVNAPGKTVTLRDIAIDHVQPCTATTSYNGVKLLSAATLNVENVQIRGFGGAAVSAENTADSTLNVDDVDARDSCTTGILAKPAAGKTLTATVTDSHLSRVGTGILADAGATVGISRNTIVANATGIAPLNGGLINSTFTNRIGGNGADGTASNAPLPPVVVPPVVVPPVTPPATPPAVKKPVVLTCKVPKLTGLTLAGAKKKLTKARCKLGKVTYKIKRGKKRNRVYVQGSKSGATKTLNAKIAITISGRKPKKKAKAKSSAATGPVRTWVSSVGSDPNPCSRTAPCATFQTAFGKTIDGGMVSVLDGDNYGTMTINAPIAIDGGGSGAQIVAGAGANGILINAPAGKDVTIRDIEIIGPGCAAPGAGHGIRIQSGGAVHLEDVTIRNFAGSGVSVAPSAAQTVTAHGLKITNTCTSGVSVAPTAGLSGLFLTDSEITGGPTGVQAANGGRVAMGGVKITGTTTAITTSGDGTVSSWGGDALTGNGALGVTPTALPLR